MVVYAELKSRNDSFRYKRMTKIRLGDRSSSLVIGHRGIYSRALTHGISMQYLVSYYCVVIVGLLKNNSHIVL